MIRSGYAVTEPSDSYILLRMLYAAFVFFILLRIGLNALILNQFINYTTIEGSTIEKIHPAFYGIGLVALVILFNYRIVLSAQDLGILRAMIVFLAGICGLLLMLSISGQSTSSGYILDTYIVACMAAFVMMTLPAQWRSNLGELILLFLILSAIVGIGEFALRTRLLPYAAGEDVFRPTGLSDHPLQLGQWCAVGICFMSVARWKPLFKLMGVVILFVGALASGARIAGVAACVSCVLFLMLEPIPAPSRIDAIQRKLMLGIAGLVVLIAVISVMFAAGALSRFESGFVDQSSLARVSIYGVFDYLSWKEFLFGADIARVQRIALDIFGLPFIESSFVIFTVQFGLIGAILFALLLANLFRALLKGRSAIVSLAAIMFFALALTNNALSVKSADILMMTLLTMCDHTVRRVRWTP